MTKEQRETPRAKLRLVDVMDATLMTAAMGAFLLLMAAGFAMYQSTRRLAEAKDWVEHTQKIITMLENTERRADKVEMGIRLYALGRNPDNLRLTRESAILMQAAALRLEPLMADAVARRLNLDLTARTEDLSRDLQDLAAGTERPDRSLAMCRETLELLKAQEQRLVAQRTDLSQQTYNSSLRAEWLFMMLSLLTVALSFGFLTHEMLARKRAALRIAAGNEELMASVEALEETAYQSRLLMACSDELQLCVGAEQIYESAALHLSRLLPGTNGSLCMINASRNLMEVVSYWGEAGLVTGEAFSPEACCGLRLGQVRWRQQGLSEIECTHFPRSTPARYLCAPLVAHGETLGILSVDCTSDEGYRWVGQRMKKMMELLQLTSMGTASLNLRVKLENRAIRDGLTGVYNRQFMEITLERELSRVTRMEGMLAVFMLDVDHFKKFNDRYGHPAGDAMLKAVARVLTLNTRTEDTVCRYGGEEFTIILPGISPETARERAELIRMAVSRLRVALDGGGLGEVTVSIGMSRYTEDNCTGDSLLVTADRALYAAKKLGRNRVAIDGTADELTAVESAPKPVRLVSHVAEVPGAVRLSY